MAGEAEPSGSPAGRGPVRSLICMACMTSGWLKKAEARVAKADAPPGVMASYKLRVLTLKQELVVLVHSCEGLLGLKEEP